MTRSRLIPSLSTSKYLASKRGSEPRECEDSLSVNGDRGLFCIADGATEGFASRYWARLLVKHWTRFQGPLENPEELVVWAAHLGDRFNRRWQSRQMSWFAEEKARSGAYAAFVAVWFFEVRSQFYWRAIAIGDSCLVVWRQKAIIESFPLDDPENFGSRPVLLSSNRSMQNRMIENIELRTGEVLPGDALFLLTDAIAAWFLRAARSGPEEISRFEDLFNCGTHAELDEFIEQARSNGSLRNDDVGVLRIQVAP